MAYIERFQGFNKYSSLSVLQQHTMYCTLSPGCTQHLFLLTLSKFCNKCPFQTLHEVTKMLYSWKPFIYLFFRYTTEDLTNVLRTAWGGSNLDNSTKWIVYSIISSCVSSSRVNCFADTLRAFLCYCSNPITTSILLWFNLSAIMTADMCWFAFM